MTNRSPRLRTVEKSKAAFPLNDFSDEFAYKLAEHLTYIHATKVKPTIVGEEWEEIFATCIGAKWKPSNVGLDDVTLGNTAWGAKTVLGSVDQTDVRLISGRNSPHFSYGETVGSKSDPNYVGGLVLDIWNARVSAIREKYEHLRTIVLIKGKGLTDVLVFEFDTIRFDPELYEWKWNTGNNLVGYEKATSKHRFTWQPSGSQFTIIEDVPKKKLIVTIKEVGMIPLEFVLKKVGYSKDQVTITRDKLPQPKPVARKKSFAKPKRAIKR